MDDSKSAAWKDVRRTTPIDVIVIFVVFIVSATLLTVGTIHFFALWAASGFPEIPNINTNLFLLWMVPAAAWIYAWLRAKYSD